MLSKRPDGEENGNIQIYFIGEKHTLEQHQDPNQHIKRGPWVEGKLME